MHNWKEDEQKLYAPPDSPHVIHVPKQSYFIIDGGSPRGESSAAERIETLIALSEAVKHMPVSGYSPPGFTDYCVYPLERLIHSSTSTGVLADNSSWMIRQPDFIDNEAICRAFRLLYSEKNLPHLPEVAFEEFEDGLSVQVRVPNEPEKRQAASASIERFLLENGWKRRADTHREIFSSSNPQASDEVIYRVFVEEAQ